MVVMCRIARELPRATRSWLATKALSGAVAFPRGFVRSIWQRWKMDPGCTPARPSAGFHAADDRRVDEICIIASDVTVTARLRAIAAVSNPNQTDVQITVREDSALLGQRAVQRRPADAQRLGDHRNRLTGGAQCLGLSDLVGRQGAGPADR
jgi:hypothetical protein